MPLKTKKKQPYANTFDWERGKRRTGGRYPGDRNKARPEKGKTRKIKKSSLWAGESLK
jgi:hypothetical protein